MAARPVDELLTLYTLGREIVRDDRWTLNRYNKGMKAYRGDILREKKFSELTGKLHLPCPHQERTGIRIHVVIKDGYCYRSEDCMVLECKYNRYQSDIERIISVTW
jgi:hypothetical protein